MLGLVSIDKKQLIHDLIHSWYLKITKIVITIINLYKNILNLIHLLKYLLLIIVRKYIVHFQIVFKCMIIIGQFL